MSEPQHVTESAGAYVLGALTEDEVRQIEAHAQECPACQQEIRNLREVAGVLPLACAVVEPHANLKTKVVTAARRDEPAQQVLQRAAQRAADAQTLRNFWRRPVPVWAGVAGWVGVACACIVTGIFIGVTDEHARMLAALQAPPARTLSKVTAAADNAANGQLSEARSVFPVSLDQLQSQAIALIGRSQVFDLSVRHSGDHIPAKIMQVPDENHAMLVSNMPPAPAGQVYRVWLIRKGKMHLGGIVTAGKMVKTEIPMKVKMGDVIAFSMSPRSATGLPDHFWMQQTL